MKIGGIRTGGNLSVEDKESNREWLNYYADEKAQRHKDFGWPSQHGQNVKRYRNPDFEYSDINLLRQDISYIHKNICNKLTREEHEEYKKLMEGQIRQIDVKLENLKKQKRAELVGPMTYASLRDDSIGEYSGFFELLKKGFYGKTGVDGLGIKAQEELHSIIHKSLLEGMFESGYGKRKFNLEVSAMDGFTIELLGGRFYDDDKFCYDTKREIDPTNLSFAGSFDGGVILRGNRVYPECVHMRMKPNNYANSMIEKLTEDLPLFSKIYFTGLALENLSGDNVNCFSAQKVMSIVERNDLLHLPNGNCNTLLVEGIREGINRNSKTRDCFLRYGYFKNLGPSIPAKKKG